MRRRRLLTAEPPSDTEELVQDIARMALPLERPADLDPLLERIGDARYVLLGEASHGTSEYYRWRAEISRRLIREKGFSFIAVEGDWPDCYRVNRYVKGLPDSGTDAREVLDAFARWPTWMWANEEVAELAEWLRRHDAGLPDDRKVGFYGLDVYSLWDSLYAVLGYLRKADPSALPAALRAFRCFEPYGEDVQEYARATVLVPASCEDEVVALLRELRRDEPRYAADGREEFFAAEQNALVVQNAEAVLPGHGARRAGILEHPRPPHDRDPGAADAATTGRAPRPSSGSTTPTSATHGSPTWRMTAWSTSASSCGSGTPTTGWSWSASGRTAAPSSPAGSGRRRWRRCRSRRRVGSWEDVLHRAGDEDKLLLFEGVLDADDFLQERGHRAIGVVYHPENERFGNYVPTVLPRRYDAFCYIDETRALHPLHPSPDPREGARDVSLGGVRPVGANERGR